MRAHRTDMTLIAVGCAIASALWLRQPEPVRVCPSAIPSSANPFADSLL